MDFPFEGISTVPPRKDMDHMVGASDAASPALALSLAPICSIQLRRSLTGACRQRCES